MNGNEPWWAKGLQFSCLRCGRCCRGEPGTVLVSCEEASKISDRTGIPVEAFAKTIRFFGKEQLSLRERLSGECVFYEKETAKCLLYDLRPSQCRLYPFWPSILKSKRAWEKERSRCPGIGSGKWYSPEDIGGFLNKAAHPEL